MYISDSTVHPIHIATHCQTDTTQGKSVYIASRKEFVVHVALHMQFPC